MIYFWIALLRTSQLLIMMVAANGCRKWSICVESWCAVTIIVECRVWTTRNDG
jgi:hypothetical protein